MTLWQLERLSVDIERIDAEIAGEEAEIQQLHEDLALHRESLRMLRRERDNARAAIKQLTESWGSAVPS